MHNLNELSALTIRKKIFFMRIKFDKFLVTILKDRVTLMAATDCGVYREVCTRTSIRAGTREGWKEREWLMPLLLSFYFL